MAAIGLTAVEILAFCLGLGLLLAVLIVICNCVSTCCEMLSHRRKKQKVEKLPDDYVDEIHRLLHRNEKKNCDYDCVVVESKPQSPRLDYIVDTRVERSISRDVKVRTPVENLKRTVRMESEENNNTNTTNSQSTITASENGDVEGGIRSKRRTWGRLSNSLFDTILMPSVDTTTTEDTEHFPSVDNLRYGMKIETTV